jgi:hypothetical protein
MLLSKHLAISTETINNKLPCTELSKQKPGKKICCEDDRINKALTLASLSISNSLEKSDALRIITLLVGFRERLDIRDNVPSEVIVETRACCVASEVFGNLCR